MPLAKTKALHVLQLNIIRLVLVGFNVAIALQNRQCTVRSHESITDKLQYYNTSLLSSIYSAKWISQDSSVSPDLWWRMRSPASSWSDSKPYWTSHI